MKMMRVRLKKLSYQRRRWLKHRSAKQQKRKRNRSARLKRRNTPLPYSTPNRHIKRRKVSFYRDGKMRTAFVGEPFDVPEILDLHENYEKTVDFLKTLRLTMGERWRAWISRPDLRARIKTQNRQGIPPYFARYLDFARIKKLTPEVALIIAAEFDVSTRNQVDVFTGALDLENWNPAVVSLLDDIGFFELTNVNPPTDSILAGKNWKILRFKAGSTADGDSVQSLLAELGLDALLNNTNAFDAIAEAITNTKHHAYKDHNLPQPVIEDWWMTGFIFPQRRRVSISVWDRGLSIPATLPSWDRYPAVQRVFRRVFGGSEDMTASRYDGAAIRVAMAMGRSSTRLSHRGKGLPLIESIVSLCASGHLRIHSRFGTYERVKGQKPRAIGRKSELGGTLITWDWQFHEE